MVLGAMAGSGVGCQERTSQRESRGPQERTVVMMRAILGSAIGGLVAGAVALVATAQGRSVPEATWPNAAQTNAPYAMTVADTRGMNSASTTSPTLVQCEPHQEAVLQRSIVANREVAQVTCVTRMAPSAYAAAPYAAPAAYSQ